jgi:5-formyltetrahydrofolate cyclo-ligase
MTTAKAALRSTMRQRRDAIPAPAAADAARAAAERALALPELAAPRLVGLYAEVGSELGTGPLARALLARGTTVAYPRVVAGRPRLDFHRVSDLAELRPGTFNIPEPDPGAPVVPVERIDLFIIPGLAFDERGDRLGWGAGYYDLTLARHPDAVRVGYAFECQLVSRVPRIHTDLPMDLVVTEAAVHRTHPGGAPR